MTATRAIQRTSRSDTTDLVRASSPISVFVVAKSDFVVDGLVQIMDGQKQIRLVTCVEPSEACWYRFRDEKPDVLVLHADIFDGPPNELTSRIHDASPETRILVFGWNMAHSFLTSLLMAGVRGYINQNMSGSHLVRAIENVWAGRLWVERTVLEELATDALQMHELLERSIMERITNMRASLTPRETTVLRHVLEGQCTKQIAVDMNVSEQSVKMHLTNMFAKFNVTNRSQLILRAYAKVCPVTNMIRLFRMGLDQHRIRNGRPPLIPDPLANQ